MNVQNALTLAQARERLAAVSGVLFDLDGVLTPTADVHMRAWSDLFTRYLADRGLAGYSDSDYFQFIDGKPRYDGVRTFLASRGVVLPDGLPTDEPGDDTVCALGNSKNAVFNRIVEEEGVTPYPGSLAFLDAVVDAGHPVAVVTSSRNGRMVLDGAGLTPRFTVVVDGEVSAAHGLAGKPAPATYEYGATMLGLTAAQCVVVEDAHSGVQAGRAGGFGLVIGVDRGVGAQVLLDAGADIVVSDLADLLPLAAASTSPSSDSKARA
jgi:HAD superfamily hydrolase (TIGR01509 family)